MNRASLILSMIIGSTGFLGAIFALLVNAFGSDPGAGNANEAVLKGFAAIPLALLGIVGAWAIAEPEGRDHDAC